MTPLKIAPMGALLLLSGCSVDLDDVFAGLSLDGPFEADVSADGIPEAEIRCGIFVESPEGSGLLLRVGYSDGGAIEGVSFGGSPDADFAVAPLAACDGVGQQTFTLPELSVDTSLIVAAWHDENGNNMLDITDTGGEPAFALHRLDDGEDYYLTSYEYNAADDNYRATAVSPSVRSYSPSCRTPGPLYAPGSLTSCSPKRPSPGSPTSPKSSTGSMSSPRSKPKAAEGGILSSGQKYA